MFVVTQVNNYMLICQQSNHAITIDQSHSEINLSQLPHQTPMCMHYYCNSAHYHVKKGFWWVTTFLGPKFFSLEQSLKFPKKFQHNVPVLRLKQD